MINLVQNSRFSAWLGAAVLGSSLLASCAKDTIAPNEPSPATSVNSATKISGQAVAGKYIVVLKEGSVELDNATAASQELNEARYAARGERVRGVAQGMLRQRGLRADKVGRTYSQVLRGFAANLTPAEAADLAQDARVAYVEPDQVMTIEQTTAPTITTVSTQAIPYGIKRVGTASGVGKTVWILDTGVDLTHPDLTVDKARSRTFYPIGADAASANDLNGHGTHVAGTIAAKNNNVGVVGVAAGATVVAVKVMSATGSSSSSVVIAGLDYVAATAKAGDVVNMSLGGGISQSLDAAVVRAANKGILFAVAAGNDAKSATLHSPSRVNHANVFTVTAMNNLDTWAPFSCFGNPTVDYCMPGVAVQSTYKGGGYSLMSGTSMAAPHMAGVLLVRGKSFTRSGSVKSDPDGTADAIAHL